MTDFVHRQLNSYLDQAHNVLLKRITKIEIESKTSLDINQELDFDRIRLNVSGVMPNIEAR